MLVGAEEVVFEVVVDAGAVLELDAVVDATPGIHCE